MEFAMPASHTTIEQKCRRCPAWRTAPSAGSGRLCHFCFLDQSLRLGKYPDFTFERFQGI
jgi:hypothetical protein